MQRYFITFAYDGTLYHGWQRQPNGISVQEVLEKTLSTILRRNIEVVGAGRTDAGVHAHKMVAHFDWDDVHGNGESPAMLDTPQLVYRMNRMLPKDVSVSRIEPVDEEMHARFSAKWRTYHYYVHTRKDPFLRHYSLETHYDLDFELMNRAGEMMKSHKDFAAFCKAGADNKTTLCDLAVVGTMFLIGRHKMTLEEFEKVLCEGTRSDAGESMPGNALFLWDIIY